MRAKLLENNPKATEKVKIIYKKVNSQAIATMEKWKFIDFVEKNQ